MSDTKTCEACGAAFTRDPNSMSRARWEKRTACTHACAMRLRAAKHAGLTITEYNTLVNATRYCEVCGDPIPKQRDKSLIWNAQRKFCGSKCSIHNASTHRLGHEPGSRPRKRERERRQRFEAESAPVGPWEPPQRTPSPKPDPVPTRAAPTPPRASQALTRALALAINQHPELRLAFTDPAFGLYVGGQTDNGTGYGVGVRKARDKHRRTHA